MTPTEGHSEEDPIRARMVTRGDHIAWCKMRALEYVDEGDLVNAVASMLSDLGKHPATSCHVGISLGVTLQFTGQLKTEEQVRKFIEGFN